MERAQDSRGTTDSQQAWTADGSRWTRKALFALCNPWPRLRTRDALSRGSSLLLTSPAQAQHPPLLLVSSRKSTNQPTAHLLKHGVWRRARHCPHTLSAIHACHAHFHGAVPTAAHTGAPPSIHSDVSTHARGTRPLRTNDALFHVHCIIRCITARLNGTSSLLHIGCTTRALQAPGLPPCLTRLVRVVRGWCCGALRAVPPAVWPPAAGARPA